MPHDRKSTHLLMIVTYVFIVVPLGIGLFLRLVPF